MGMIFFVVVLALVLATGFLEKEDKLWSYKTFIIFVSVSVGFGVAAIASNSSSPTDTERIRGVLKMGLGASIGLVYCILYTDKLRNKKFPMCAGGSVLAIAIGWIFIFFGLVSWLDKI